MKDQFGNTPDACSVKNGLVFDGYSASRIIRGEDENKDEKIYKVDLSIEKTALGRPFFKGLLLRSVQKEMYPKNSFLNPHHFIPLLFCMK